VSLPEIPKELEAAGAHIAAQLRESAETLGDVADTLVGPIARLADLVVETLGSGGKLLLCGNGGSAADAQHLAAEYVVRFRRTRRSLPAIALTTDTSVLTAGGNDLGFEHVFARQVEALGAPGDLLILHSTSGNSPNLLAAADVARSLGIRTAALLGAGGGALRDRVDLAIVVPTEGTARAQEAHIAIGHAVADWIDAHESMKRGEAADD
jgi:D-sedoheptulose 7-phosphate isomerase